MYWSRFFRERKSVGSGKREERGGWEGGREEGRGDEGWLIDFKKFAQAIM